ncbi:unnamed protein product [Urochloa decumbens]|uniref:Uncharacterized protein n=1 Tax=Urochloa decumbens TaxID=240449 RepID=A0ABC8W850_9POAL
MDKTSSRIALLVPAPVDDPHSAQPAEPPAEEAKAGRTRRALSAVVFLSSVAVIGLIAYGTAPLAWRARHDPVELARVVAPCALLAALFVCQHRAERLTPESPPGERWLLHAAHWVLTAVIIWLQWYQSPQALQEALVLTGLFVMCVVVPMGFCVLLAVCLRRRRDQQYQELDGAVDGDATAGDGKDFKAARPTEDLV